MPVYITCLWQGELIPSGTLCVCVCVCAERERERERENQSNHDSSNSSQPEDVHIPKVCTGAKWSI